jgi:hypothetical protein
MMDVVIFANTMFTLFGSNEFSVNQSAYIGLALAGAVLIALPPLFGKWFVQKRQLRSSYITTKFAAPADLTPAEMQYFFLPSKTITVVKATIVDLANRGYLQIENTSGGDVLHTRKDQKPIALRSYEQMILSQASTVGGVLAVDVINQPIAYMDNGSSQKQKRLAGFNEHVHESLVQLNLVRSRGVDKFFITCAVITALLVGSLIWWPIMLLWFMSLLASGSSSLSSVLYFMALAGIITLITIIPLLFGSMLIARFRSHFFGRRWMSSVKLDSLWPQIVAYRNFVRLAHAGKLTYESPSLEKDSQRRIAPYAIALGFTTDI